jgi:hypothetical protein
MRYGPDQAENRCISRCACDVDVSTHDLYLLLPTIAQRCSPVCPAGGQPTYRLAGTGRGRWRRGHQHGCS